MYPLGTEEVLLQLDLVCLGLLELGLELIKGEQVKVGPLDASLLANTAHLNQSLVLFSNRFISLEDHLLVDSDLVVKLLLTHASA